MDNQNNNGQTPSDQAPAEGATPASWDDFLGKQDPAIQELYKGHTTGLLNTVKATRDERDTFKAQVKDLLKTAEEGSELKSQLESMQASLEHTERKAAFLEEAVKPETQCRNPKAAFLIAESNGLFRKNGTPDWEAIKAEAPELFGTVAVQHNAGQGTQQDPKPTKSMNDFIRKASGRTT